MQLSERKKRILTAIVNEYIETAEPVGSETIAKKHEAGCSSATIRNEMADLEELGYLDKPHTSAGRVPSGRGYRLYVNSLMPSYSLSEQETELLKRAFMQRLYHIDNLVAEASDFISRLTNYTVIASDCFEDDPRKSVYTGGVVNIFNHPEYKNLEKARRLIGFMDSRDSIYEIISGFEGEDSIKITIGDENTYEDLKDCSVIVSHYYDRDGRRGGLGIIGPTRMQYGRVVSSLHTVTALLNALINKKK